MFDGQQKDFLGPLKGDPKKKPFVVFDIESKKDDTQGRGFTRPFMVGFSDGPENFTAFFNDAKVAGLPWAERAVSRGGCIDKFMRHALGQKEDGRYDFTYKGCDVYAHNLGAFDGLFIPAWLEKNRHWVSYKLMPIQSRIQAIEIWRYKSSRPRRTFEERKKADQQDRKLGVLRFLDSFRVMPVSLNKIIQMFQLRDNNEGKMKIDLDLPEYDVETWIAYNRVDTVMLWRGMMKYQGLIDEMGGEVGITAPSTAVKLLRRKYIPDDLKIYRNIHFPECPKDGCEGCAHKFVRQGYFGGRTEVYMLRGEGYYYDVNSSYPFSMKKPMPIGEMEVTNENEDFSRYTNGDWVGFVQCTVEIPNTCYLPPLPLYTGGKLKFPVGRFSGTWDWVELECLKKIGGRILHVEKAVWIRSHRFLGDFVDSLYALRSKKMKKEQPGKAETAKIMMNSTFGKFGMEQNRLEMIILKPGEEEPYRSRYPGESVPAWERRKSMEKQKTRDKRHGRGRSGNLTSRGDGYTRTPDMTMPSASYEHDSLIRIRDIRVDAVYIIPQIAAHITALSRVLLWTYAMEIMERGGKIFYSDTDSLLTDYGGLSDNDELGGLKKEFNGERIRVIAYGPKTYVLEKDIPFEGEHDQDESVGDKEGQRRCLDKCPGCLKREGKLVQGEHETDEKGRKCKSACPGCATHKVMMKGVPKNLRTRKTLERMHDGKEEVSFQLHEKLGALAKAGLRRTPLMVDIKKSMKSTYDKRAIATDGNDTLPLVFADPTYISPPFILRATDPEYRIPKWLGEVG